MTKIQIKINTLEVLGRSETTTFKLMMEMLVIFTVFVSYGKLEDKDLVLDKQKLLHGFQGVCIF